MKLHLFQFGLAVAGAVLLLCGHVAQTNSVGPTPIGGVIARDTTWTLTNSPYVVTSDVLVSSGVTLTIEPGVEVRFSDGMGLQVNGKLIARGADTQRIVFTSNQAPAVPGAWRNIYFTDSSPGAIFDRNGNYVDGSILQYCTVLYGGGGNAVSGAIQIEDTSPAIDHCTIGLSMTAGIHASNPPNLLISNNVLRGNDLGIHVDGAAATSATDVANNFVLQNTTDGISVNTSAFTVTANIVHGNGGRGVVVEEQVGVGSSGRIIAENAILDNGEMGFAAKDARGGLIANNTLLNEDNTIADASWSYSGNNMLAPLGEYKLFFVGEPGTTLAAAGNWWGTSSEVEVQQRIFDSNDVANVGTVVYSPFLTAPNLAAPISPPQDVVVQSTDSGEILISWTQNPEDDAMGYRVFYGTASRYQWTDNPEQLNQYDHVADVGTFTSYLVPGAYDHITFFSVTAYDLDADGNGDWTAGNESWFSEEISYAGLPKIHLGGDRYSIKEGLSQITIPVHLSAPLNQAVAVEYTTVGNTAQAGDDYLLSRGILTFSPGEQMKTITIPLLADDIYEALEDFDVALLNPNGAVLGEPVRANIIVEDDDEPPTVGFASDSYVVGEGDELAVLNVELSFPAPMRTTVDYYTVERSAHNNVDYGPRTGQLSFGPGETIQTILVPIMDNHAFENTEDFQVVLTDAVAIDLGLPSIATVMIQDDDTKPAIHFGAADYSLEERHGNVTLTVDINADSLVPTTVDFATVKGSAEPGDDFVTMTGTLTFAPSQSSQTIVVPIVNDTAPESAESFTVVLTNPGEANLVSPATATVTIEDDDPAPVMVEAPGDPNTPVQLSIPIPAGAAKLRLQGVQTGGFLTLTLSLAPQAPPPDNYAVLATYYNIDAPGVTFDQAEVSFAYRHGELNAAGVSEPSLRLLQYKNGAWFDITSTLDTETNRITGHTDSLSLFMLGERFVTDCGASINGGAIYVGDLDAEVFLNTAGATQVLVSNDAGFAGAQWQPYSSALSWRLTDPGNRIATLVTYLRLRGEGETPLCSGLTFGDDIIYDPLAPTVYVIGGDTAMTTHESPQQIVAPVPIVVVGADQAGGSGVTEMQIATNSSFLGAKWQPYQTNTFVNVTGTQDFYVRVRDGAGNVSIGFWIRLTANYALLLPFVQR